MNPTVKMSTQQNLYYNEDENVWLKQVGPGRVAKWCRGCDRKLKDCVCGVLNLTHKMVLDCMLTCCYHGTSFSDVTDYYRPFTKQDFLDWFEDWVADNTENYDCKVFPILATPSIRDNLDYDLLIRVWEEMTWELFVYELFRDLSVDDHEEYWRLYEKVESRVKCDWS